MKKKFNNLKKQEEENLKKVKKMLKIDDLKKLLENSNLKFKETENGIVVFKEEEYNHLFEIKQILKTFGISDDDITLDTEGTIVNAKQYDAQKLKMLLSPFYPLDKMEVVDPYHLKINDLFIDNLNEGEDLDVNGSADDLGEVPEAPEGLVSIDDLANVLNKEFPDAEIVIISNNEMELPSIPEIIDYLKSIEDQLEKFDIEITDDKIIVKGN
jgi:intein-encoded DNA endonuclease-like protein